MKKQILLLTALYFVLLFPSKALSWTYGSWVSASNANLLAAKAEAVTTGNPVILLIGNLSNCTHCKNVWPLALCDGGENHSKGNYTCSAYDEVYGKHPIVQYSIQNRIILLDVSTISNTSMYSRLTSGNGYKRNGLTTALPSILILRAKSTATVGTDGTTAFDNTEMDYLGSFLFRGNQTVNGITFPTESAIRFSDFRKAVESFGIKAVSTLTGYEDATDLNDITTTESSLTGLTLTRTSTQLWFRFTPTANKTFAFKCTNTGDSLSADVTTGYAFHTVSSADDLTPILPALNADSGTAFTSLSSPFYITPTDTQDIYLRIYQIGASDNITFTMTTRMLGDNEQEQEQKQEETGENTGTWEYSMWYEPTELSTILTLKKAAKENNRPIIIMTGNLSNCTHCKNVWPRALCDGGKNHDKGNYTCSAYDATYGKHPIVEYARRKKLLLLSVSTIEFSKLYTRLYGSKGYKKYGLTSALPSITILRAKDSADTTSADISLLDNTEMDFIGSFLFREKQKVNGITFPAESSITFADFQAAIESFFPNDYWDSINPPVETHQYDDATALENFSATAVASLTGLNLNGKNTANWFTFNATANTRYSFYGQLTEDSDFSENFNLTAEFFLADDNGAPSTSMKSVTKANFKTLDEGFYLDVTSAGQYYLKISRDNESTDCSSLYYTLQYHQATGNPAPGEITNPFWSTAPLGKWTMDYESAKVNAAANGKPILLTFAAPKWCPYCFKLEKSLFATSDFQSWAQANAYLVIMDCRKRADANGLITGPALLTDDSDKGFLETNSISAKTAANRLADNLTIQHKLALKWDNGKIYYPTILFLRSDATIAGRLDYNATLPQLKAFTTIAKIDNGDTFEEDDNYASYAENDSLTIDDGSTWDAFVGDPDNADWRSFTTSAGAQWSFNATGTATQTFTIEIYDNSGRNDTEYTNDTTGPNGILKASASGILANGVSLSFVPDEDGDYRLKLTSDGTTIPYNMAVTAITTNYGVTFEDTDIRAAQKWNTVSIPVTLSEYYKDTEDVVITYQTEDGTAKAGIHYTTTTGSITWDTLDKANAPIKYIEVPLTTAALDNWDGSLDFKISISVTSGACRIKSHTATVSIFSRPVFLNSDPITLSLISGIKMADLLIPIATGIDGEIAVSAISGTGPLPDGISLSVVSEPELAVLISGTPTTITPSVTAELQLKIGLINGYDTKSVTFTVSNLSDINPYGLKASFTGALYEKDDSGDSHVRGTFNLTVDDYGTITATANTTIKDGTSITFNANGWSSCETTSAALVLNAANGLSSFTLTVDTTGLCTGSFYSTGLFDEDNPLQIHATPLTNWITDQDITDFQGYYTVSLQPDNIGTEPFGGILLTIDESANASFTGFLPDAAAFSGTSTLVFESIQNSLPQPAITIFAATKNADENTEYIGVKLIIQPKSERSTSESCVASCIIRSKWYQADNTETILTPCGTSFDKSLTITKQLNNGYHSYYAVAAYPDFLDGVIAPPRGLLLSENDDASFSVTDPSDPLFNFILTPETDDDGFTGLFTGSFTLYAEALSPMAQSTRFTSFKGIFTPINKSCCGGEENIPIGQGTFLINDNAGIQHAFALSIYSMANATAEDGLPETAKATTILAGASQDAPNDILWPDNTSIFITAPKANILALNTTTGEVIFIVGAGANTSAATLSGGDWRLFTIGDLGTHESLSTSIRIAQNNNILTLNTEDNPWHIGWNLIAIPFSVSEITTKEAKDFCTKWSPMTIKNKSYVFADTISQGHAYWLFITEIPDEPISLSGNPDNNPQYPDSGWFFSAKPNSFSNAFIWDGCKYLETKTTGDIPATAGGWFLIE